MKRLIVLAMIMTSLVTLNACGIRLGMKLKSLDSPAVIALSPGKDATLIGSNGKDAEPCSTDPKAGEKMKVCPANDANAKVIRTQTLKITQTEGSICFTIEDPVTHIATFRCWP